MGPAREVAKSEILVLHPSPSLLPMGTQMLVWLAILRIQENKNALEDQETWNDKSLLWERRSGSYICLYDRWQEMRSLRA